MQSLVVFMDQSNQSKNYFKKHLSSKFKCIFLFSLLFFFTIFVFMFYLAVNESTSPRALKLLCGSIYWWDCHNTAWCPVLYLSPDWFTNADSAPTERRGQRSLFQSPSSVFFEWCDWSNCWAGGRAFEPFSGPSSSPFQVRCYSNLMKCQILLKLSTFCFYPKAVTVCILPKRCPL